MEWMVLFSEFGKEEKRFYTCEVNLHIEIELLKKELTLVKEELKLKEKALDEAVDQLDEKDSLIVELEARVKKLELIVNYSKENKVEKTSRNSNLPPSKDKVKQKRNYNNRNKTNRKVGGQLGHKGYNLKPFDKANIHIPILSKKCTCGKCLNPLDKKFLDFRQVVDIPKPTFDIYQYDRYSIDCSHCGKTCTPNYPQDVTKNVQYGPRVRALTAYLSVYQFIPFKRLQDFFKVTFNLKIAQASFVNFINVTAKKCEGPYQFIKEFLANSKYVGADETFLTVNGDNFYNWVWQNKKATFIVCESSRKKDVIYKYFPHGFPNAILGSDRLAAHLSTPAKGHQICWIHILRLLKYLEDTENNTWLQKLFKIFDKAKNLKKQKAQWDIQHPKIVELEKECNNLLAWDIDKELFSETFTLCNSLINKRNMLFQFLYHEDVPFHNNDSERAIRNIKIKMKVSGQFKNNQNQYAVIRSIIDTAIKNHISIFDILFDIEKRNDIAFGF